MKKSLIKILALTLLGLTVVSAVSCGFSYMEDDISEYAELDKAAFDALAVTLPTNYEVTEEDIEDAIRTNLFAKKTSVNGGATELTGTIGDGDNVRLWYFGTVDMGDGKSETIRDAASSNTYTNTPMWAVAGAGDLRIEALENALVGAKVEDYLAVTKGEVKQDAVYFLSYYYNEINADGKYIGWNKFDGVNRVPAAEMDTIMGAVGLKAEFDKTVVGETFDIDSNKFYEMTVDGTFPNGSVKREYHIRVCGQAENELFVEGKFANDGGKYADKNVKMHVQLFGFVDYNVPELNADTVVNIFKIGKDSEDPVAEYRKEIKKSLEADSTRISALESAIWVELKKCVTIKELPKSKVNMMYDIFYDTVKTYYKEAQSDDLREDFAAAYGEAAMENLDTFTVAMLSGQKGQKAKEVVREKAESWVREDLIVFAIVKYSGMEMPTEAAVNAGADADIADIIKESGRTAEELYDAYGGREYFIAGFYREHILDKLCSSVKITYQDNVM